MFDNNSESKLKKAKIKLFKSSEGLKFFGILSQKFNYNIIDLGDEKVEGFVKYNDQSKDVFINKTYVNKDDYTHDNLIALIVHEILHILFKHTSGKRSLDKIKPLWNLACDHVVEKELKKMGLKPYGGYNIFEEFDAINPNPRAEDVYEWLLNKNCSLKKLSENENYDTFSVQFCDSKYSSNASSAQFCDSKNSEKIIQVSKQCELGEKEEKKFIAEASSLKELLKEKGHISGKLVELLDELLKVEVPWEEIFNKSIKSKVPINNELRSWKKPSIYFIPHNIFIPGELPEDIDKLNTLYIAIDTSGSISTEELKKFADVINQSMRYYDKIELIIHDSNIKEIRNYNKNDNNRFINDIKTLGFSGRGGTSHKEVFEYVKKNFEKNPEIFSLFISLTDGVSDIEENIFLIKNIETIFLISGGSSTRKTFFAVSINNEHITFINIY